MLDDIESNHWMKSLEYFSEGKVFPHDIRESEVIESFVKKFDSLTMRFNNTLDGDRPRFRVGARNIREAFVSFGLVRGQISVFNRKIEIFVSDPEGRNKKLLLHWESGVFGLKFYHRKPVKPGASFWSRSTKRPAATCYEFITLECICRYLVEMLMDFSTIRA